MSARRQTDMMWADDSQVPPQDWAGSGGKGMRPPLAPCYADPTGGCWRMTSSIVTIRAVMVEGFRCWNTSPKVPGCFQSHHGPAMGSDCCGCVPFPRARVRPYRFAPSRVWVLGAMRVPHVPLGPSAP